MRRDRILCLLLALTLTLSGCATAAAATAAQNRSRRDAANSSAPRISQNPPVL